MSFVAIPTCEIQKGSAPRNKPEALEQTNKINKQIKHLWALRPQHRHVQLL